MAPNQDFFFITSKSFVDHSEMSIHLCLKKMLPGAVYCNCYLMSYISHKMHQKLEIPSQPDKVKQSRKNLRFDDVTKFGPFED
jgi:hypothetical protein